MLFLGLVFLSSMPPPGLVSAEFYSDVDSREGDEAKALEIKAKDFWQGLLDSAQGLEATRNAELSGRVESNLKQLPPDYDEVRELFNKATSHLAKADSMLFEEASRSKMMALQRLENGAPREALVDYVSHIEDALYAAYSRFVGYRTYEKKLARHILSRLTEVRPAIDSAVDMAPQMYEESEKASNFARNVVQSSDLGHKKRDNVLRDLANEIITATGRQRKRFTEYIFSSLLTAATDMAGEEEAPASTVMKATLRGAALAEEHCEPFLQVEEANEEKKKPVILLGQADKEFQWTSTSEEFHVAEEKEKAVPVDDLPPLVFFDGVPVDAVPISVL